MELNFAGRLTHREGVAHPSDEKDRTITITEETLRFTLQVECFTCRAPFTASVAALREMTSRHRNRTLCAQCLPE